MGVPVYVATLGAGSSVFRRSRWVRAAADFHSDSDLVVGDILSWLGRTLVGGGPIPVLALSDRTAELLNAARGEIPDKYRPVLPSVEILEPLLTKSDAAAVAVAAGLRVPEWVGVASADDVAAITQLKFPVVVRPEASTTSGGEASKVELLGDPVVAAARIGELVGHGARLVVSEFVEAPVEAVEFGVVWRSLDGTSTAVCTGRKRRQAGPDGGVMAWGEAVDLPDVRQGAIDFLDASGFRGVGGIEFIRADGKLWFIEFNPRLEAIHFLASRAGVDTVLMAYRDAAFDERPACVPTQVAATGWVGSAWAQRLIAEPGEWRHALRDRVAFARSPNRVRAVMGRRDPAATLALAAYFGGRAWTRLRRLAGRAPAL